MNEMVRMPAVGTRDGDWVWDGTRWVCDPDCDFPSPCPPFSILQPGGVHSPFFPPPVTQPPWYPGANGGVSFAPPGQPPPNPIRGAFWWDGTNLMLFDGAAWVVVGAGGGSVITPPGTGFPPNPVPGQNFFDGTTLWIWNGSSWLAIGPGPGSGISSPNIYSVTTFTNPGAFSFTIPNDVTTLTAFKFHLIGGGGGGGGCMTGTFSAQGGGGGEYKQVALIGAIKGTIVSCTVGDLGHGGAATGAPGQNGQNSQLVIANTNTTVVAQGGFGGWGNQTSGTNNNTEGTGGKNGVFTPGTSNLMLVMSVPGADAHLPSPSDWGNPGGDSFLGHADPGFDNSVGWNDTTRPRGYGGGGRGAFNNGQAGGNGTQGVMIVERTNG